MHNNALLGFLDVLLATGDLDLGLLMYRLLLLTSHFLLFVIVLVQEVNLDTKLVTKLVDARALCTDDPTDKFLTNLELGRLTVETAKSKHAYMRQEKVFLT